MYSLITFICWGLTDLFYKKGNIGKNKYNHLKTGIIVGLVMGIHATIYMIIKNLSFDFVELIKYLPVSFCYIISMIIGYKGLKYLELSLSSPIQNTSGVITSLLLLLFFKEEYPLIAYLGIMLVFFGIVIISYLEQKENRSTKLKITKNKNINLLIILFPLIYCFFDGIGTFLDALYLDKFSIISEDNALICYEYTFLVYAIASFIYLNRKKEKIKILQEKDKVIAALLETTGQFFYVFAMAKDSTIGATIVGSYCLLSLILSHIFLKEKLSHGKYIGLLIAIIGIITLAILDI